MLLLTKNDIKDVFTMEMAIETVKEAFAIYSDGKSDNPLRINLPAKKHNGTLLFMPAYAEEMDAATLKIVNIYPENVNKGLPSLLAQVVLVDATTGEIAAVLNGNSITEIRTGAASGACFDLLGRKDAKVGALIGTGSQAESQLEAMMTARDLDAVMVYDSSIDRAAAFVENMTKKFSAFRTEIKVAMTSDEAVENADLLITVTPSNKPVFDAKKCKPGITISCVGSYQPHMQEMDPEILVKASKIYFDSKSDVLIEAGDIIIPLEKGLITEKDFTGEIGELINGKIVGRENDEEIIVFKTVGIGTQDLVTAKAVYEKAIEAGKGMRWEG